MNRCVVLMASRYLLSDKEERSVSVMVRICFVGILIGSCALALVVAVMSGFEKATHEKMRGIHADLTIRSSHEGLDIEAIGRVLDKEFPDVVAYSPQSTGQAMLHVGAVHDPANIVTIKGIDPQREAATSELASKIVEPRSPPEALAHAVHDSHILVGSRCASACNVTVGDNVDLVYMVDEGDEDRGVTFASRTAVVGGIFKTGIDDFDCVLIFCSEAFFSQMFPDEAPKALNLKVKAGSVERDLVSSLKKRFGLEVYSWKDLYPALVAALRLEKYVMFFILALIVLVASMNMVSLLFMYMHHKRADIAVLKATGMGSRDIATIFFFVGMALSLTGTLLGLAIAWLIGIILKHYPIIKLPDAYYVTCLPVELELGNFVLIFCTVMFMGVIATWLPTRRISDIDITPTLRFEV